MCRLRINLITNVSDESQKDECELFLSLSSMLHPEHAHYSDWSNCALWLARDRSEGRKHAEPRRVVLRKTQVDLGLKICGGNLTGVFVEALEEDSPARGADGLQPGDLILEVLVHQKQPLVTLFDSVLDGVVMSFPVCSVTRWVWRIRPLRRCIWRCWNLRRTSPSESRTDPNTSGGSKTHSETVFTSGNRLKPVCLSVRNRSRVSTGIQNHPSLIIPLIIKINVIYWNYDLSLAAFYGLIFVYNNT